jgi:ABC-type sugar transport system substrate-binding protein
MKKSKHFQFTFTHITFGNDAPQSKRLCYVGTDDYKAGWVAGKEVTQWLNGQGEIGISGLRPVS